MRRLITAWIVVVVLTLMYLVIDGSVNGASMAASVGVIALALVKMRVILREFMDVRQAPGILRTMTDVLVIVMGAALIGTYLVGRAVA